MYKMATTQTTHLHTISVSKARSQLKALLTRIEEADQAIALERHGRPVAVILSLQRYRALLGEAAALLTATEPYAGERMKQALDLGQALEQLKVELGR
jgi:PHD/YefM family antitoxin component YafN of YafNO toxin-antitoxin module